MAAAAARTLVSVQTLPTLNEIATDSPATVPLSAPTPSTMFIVTPHRTAGSLMPYRRRPVTRPPPNRGVLGELFLGFPEFWAEVPTAQAKVVACLLRPRSGAAGARSGGKRKRSLKDEPKDDGCGGEIYVLRFYDFSRSDHKRVFAR